MKYKAIIYDLDGTVVDTLKANFIPLQELVKEELKLDIPYEELLIYATYPGLKTIAALGFPHIEESYQKWVDKVNAYPEGAKVYDGIKEVLAAVAKLKVTQAVVSSKKKAQYQIDIVNKGLDHYFFVTILEEDTVKHKPEPDPLLACCEQLKLQPKEVLYIGDGYSDYQSCLAAGIDFGFATWGSVEKREMKPTYTLNSPLDLLAIL